MFYGQIFFGIYHNPSCPASHPNASSKSAEAGINSLQYGHISRYPVAQSLASSPSRFGLNLQSEQPKVWCLVAGQTHATSTDYIIG
jgi:hypothetical protein